ncbi:MAG: hypothetical protein U0Q22_17230 [Acidimicrobiales bacterium]
MTDTRTPHETRPADATGDDAAPSTIRKWGMRTLIAIAASSSLVWIGAIVYGTFGDYHLSGWLEDRTFPKAAEPICKKAMADLKKFPQAHESKTPHDRAVVVRETTARLQEMLDDLRAVVPKTADAKWINLWIDDWGTHLKDRLDFARRLDTKGAGEEFFESTKANTQISKSLDAYAENNQMVSCETPGDV